jgi:hypothetical protein
LRWWHRLHPDYGLAVVGGYNGLVPVDVDTDDPQIKAAVLRALPSLVFPLSTALAGLVMVRVAIGSGGSGDGP